MEPKYTSREAQAMAEVGRTAIRPSLARILTFAFLLAIAIVPAVQQTGDVRAFFLGKRATPVPQCYDIFRKPPGVAEAFGRKGLNIFQRIVAANRALMRTMRSYEDRLENDSIVCARIRPPIQYALSRWLGAGNEKAYCGPHPWLFYRSDIEYLTGPGFLNPARLARRARSAAETEAAPLPDPRPAIIDFHRQLATRGIKLIVLPVPPKPAVHPDKFTGRIGPGRAALQNESFAGFVSALKKEGVLVADPAPALASAGQDSFLATDTHWRPEAMERAARFLKEFIGSNAPLETRPPAGYRVRADAATNRGDIAVMLRLPERATGYPTEKVSLRRIETARGETWSADESSDVLMLGDSFCNIYSLDAMGWGESAGLAEQLSFELQRPLDRLVMNDNGAFATRALLARELSRGRDRLAGKRLVIWQFAMRELASGDWKEVKLALGRPTPEIFATPPAGQTWTVRGVVRAASPVPRPGSVPYKDHVAAVHLVDLESADPGFRGNQALVYMLGMRDNIRTPASNLRPGDAVTLRLNPWQDASGRYERINRTELPDESLQVAEPCWGEMIAVAP